MPRDRRSRRVHRARAPSSALPAPGRRVRSRRPQPHRRGGAATVDQIEAANGRATFVHCDVARAPDCEALVDATRQRYGALQVLHNNAGVAWVGRDGFAANMKPEDWDAIIAINLSGTFYC